MPIDLTYHTSLKTCAHAHSLIELTEIQQLPFLADKLKNQSFIILGSGSNVLFADNYSGSVIVNCLLGQTVVEETDGYAIVRFGAGENWHDSVCKMTLFGFYGLENLALIPGTMGAAPVQNIGAYGVEVADFVENVEVFDLIEGKNKTLTSVDCQFTYRDSIFKREKNRNRYLITAVTLRLSKQFNPVLSYRGLNVSDDDNFTAKQLLEQVIEVRQSKLPDPNVLPNAGSFFKNPIVLRCHLTDLQETYPDMPFFDVDESRVKIPAAWLLETSGFKGLRRENGAGVYEKHALILVNRGQAHGRDIYALACDMMEKVKEQFSIDIVTEVRVVGAEKS